MCLYVYDIGNELKVTKAEWCDDYFHEVYVNGQQCDNDCKKKFGGIATGKCESASSICICDYLC